MPIVHFKIHCLGDRRRPGKMDSIIILGLIAFTMPVINSTVWSLDHMAPWHVDRRSEETISRYCGQGFHWRENTKQSTFVESCRPKKK